MELIFRGKTLEGSLLPRETCWGFVLIVMMSAHQDRQQNPRTSHCLISSGNIKLINQLRFLLTEAVRVCSSGSASHCTSLMAMNSWERQSPTLGRESNVSLSFSYLFLLFEVLGIFVLVLFRFVLFCFILGCISLEQENALK